MGRATLIHQAKAYTPIQRQMPEIDAQAYHKIHGHTLDLCIASEMARVYGEDQARAIRHCANQIRRQTYDQNMYHLCNVLRKTPDDVRVVHGVATIIKAMKEDGVI